MDESGRYKNIGLRGVTVADTKVSFIDGEKGILLYRGFRIQDLAEKSSFTETAYLLLNGTLPTRQQLTEFEKELVAAREIPEYIYQSFRQWPKEADPMDVLQAAVPLLAMDDADAQEETREANVRMATRLMARLPVLVAGWDRIRKGLDPVPADAMRSTILALQSLSEWPEFKRIFGDSDATARATADD